MFLYQSCKIHIFDKFLFFSIGYNKKQNICKYKMATKLNHKTPFYGLNFDSQNNIVLTFFIS